VLTLWNRHGRVIPNTGGIWDIDSGSTHVADDDTGRTLCGVWVPGFASEQERKGWFSAGGFYGNLEEVSCQRCAAAARRIA
jgi:hypothetical protein